MLNVVFVGNCQIESLSTLYGKFVAPHVPTNRTYIASHNKLTERGSAALRQADVLVQQVSGFRTEKPIADLKPGATVYPVPVVTGGFLWPFSGRPHPRNAPATGYPNGIYPAPNGDAYLNRLIRDGLTDRDAVEAYMRLDVASEVDLDRAYTMIMSKLRKIGDETGYAVADIIECHFRAEALFRSPYHPEARITHYLAETLFQQMGVEDRIVERIREQPLRPSVRGHELPIHPGVVSHFGLRFVRPDHRWRFMNDGFISIEEWAGRYVRYEWNDALETGLHLARSIRTHGTALEKLTEGLAGSPTSAIGWYVLAGVHMRARRYEYALTAVGRSIELEPLHAGGHGTLGRIREMTRDWEQAASAYREAVRLDPGSASFLRSLARVLTVLGREQEAASSLRLAQAIDPQQEDDGSVGESRELEAAQAEEQTAA